MLHSMELVAAQGCESARNSAQFARLTVVLGLLAFSAFRSQTPGQELIFTVPRGKRAMIEVIGLTKQYGSATVVNDLSFTVRTGTVTGFLGPNGAGKSTTMRMILGLDTPTKGRALIFGEPYDNLSKPLTKVGSLLDAIWIHTLMKDLAAEGRAVLVSSHLMSEMALTADHLIVIGAGKLIADSSTADFIARSTRSSVRVRSPQLAQLRIALQAAGLEITDLDDALEVNEAPIEQIGDIAFRAGLPLHELAGQSGSLEQAFIQLTADSVEYSDSGSGPGGPPPASPSFDAPGNAQLEGDLR